MFLKKTGLCFWSMETSVCASPRLRGRHNTDSGVPLSVPLALGPPAASKEIFPFATQLGNATTGATNAEFSPFPFGERVSRSWSKAHSHGSTRRQRVRGFGARQEPVKQGDRYWVSERRGATCPFTSICSTSPRILIFIWNHRGVSFQPPEWSVLHVMEFGKYVLNGWTDSHLTPWTPPFYALFLAMFFPLICKSFRGLSTEGTAQEHTVGRAPRALASGDSLKRWENCDICMWTNAFFPFYPKCVKMKGFPEDEQTSLKNGETKHEGQVCIW